LISADMAFLSVACRVVSNRCEWTDEAYYSDSKVR